MTSLRTLSLAPLLLLAGAPACSRSSARASSSATDGAADSACTAGASPEAAYAISNVTVEMIDAAHGQKAISAKFTAKTTARPPEHEEMRIRFSCETAVGQVTAVTARAFLGFDVRNRRDGIAVARHRLFAETPIECTLRFVSGAPGDEALETTLGDYCFGSDRKVTCGACTSTALTE